LIFVIGFLNGGFIVGRFIIGRLVTLRNLFVIGGGFIVGRPVVDCLVVQGNFSSRFLVRGIIIAAERGVPGARFPMKMITVCSNFLVVR
jgi:hypothetical protein